MSNTENNAGNTPVNNTTPDPSTPTTPATATPDTSNNSPAPQSETPADTSTPAEAPADTSTPPATPNTTNDTASNEAPAETANAANTAPASETGSSDNGGNTGGGDDNVAFIVTGGKDASVRVPKGTTYREAFQKATGGAPKSTETYRGAGSKEVRWEDKLTADTTVTVVTKTRAG